MQRTLIEGRAMTTADRETDTGLPDDLPPELNILLGVNFLYWKTNEVMEVTDIHSPLSKHERVLVLMLGSPKRMGVLAEQMQVLPSTVTAIADELETKELIMRERSPEDRRAWRLRLTDKGIATRQDVVSRVAKVFSDVSGLSQPEIDTLAAQMLTIARNIKANGLPEGAKPCR